MKYKRFLEGRRVDQKNNQGGARTLLLDIVFSRIANISQFGLLILAAFGYFYTVVPVYQKSLLDEEIAKKTLELEKKDTELAQKSAELSELTKATSDMRGKLLKSQSEVGKLKEQVSDQYAELRIRLISEFVDLGSNLCSVDTVEDGKFSDCLVRKVISSQNLSALSLRDRNLLVSLAGKANIDAEKSWKLAVDSIQAKKSEIMKIKDEVAAKCDERRSSQDYKDEYKKIEIDYQCQKEKLDTDFGEFKVKFDTLSKAGKVTGDQLSEIAEKFLAQ